MNLMIDGKIVGELKDGVLIKKGKQVVLFRNYDGFGLSTKILENTGIKKISLEYKGVLYQTTPQAFKELGITYKNKYDEQKILQRKYWASKPDGQISLL